MVRIVGRETWDEVESGHSVRNLPAFLAIIGINQLSGEKRSSCGFGNLVQGVTVYPRASTFLLDILIIMPTCYFPLVQFLYFLSYTLFV